MSTTRKTDYSYWTKQTLIDGLKQIRAVLGIGVAAALFVAVHPVVGGLCAALVIIDTVIKNIEDK
jgi:hypothetical protein